jgi:hypothetical protein
MEFGVLGFDKTPGTQSFVTGPAKVIDADIATTGAIELQSKSAVRTVRQHASAFTELEVLFGQTAFIAISWKYIHVSLTWKSFVLIETTACSNNKSLSANI